MSKSTIYYIIGFVMVAIGICRDLTGFCILAPGMFISATIENFDSFAINRMYYGEYR